MTDALTVTCPAKVNLALRVGPARADGFHPIASWMVAVSLYDQVTVQPLPAGPSTYDIAWAEDALRASPIDWPVEKDLVHRAHRLVEQQVGRPLPAAVTVRKRIPVGAGLAGGSTDGAGMLRALNDVYGLDLPRPVLNDLAMRLGSDLAFFLAGPSAIVSGRGERVEPVPRTRPIHLVLAVPPFGCPTGPVYRAFDELAGQQAGAGGEGGPVDEQAVRRLAAMDRLPPDGPFNDLAEPACRVQPALGPLRRWCEQAAGRPVHVTGSGSGLFIVADGPGQARELAGRLGESGKVVTVAVQTLTSFP